MDTTTCCVVGGGPAGAMVGLLLARAGVEVVVLEKHADFFRDFRGDTVHPSTVRLIDELGLGAEFARLPRSELTRMCMYAGDRMVVAADLTKIPGRYRHIAMVPQWDFLDLLTSAAAEEPTFTLRMRSTVTEVITEANAVRGVRYLDSDGVEHTLRADLVIACDGRDSVTREAAGLRQRMEDVPMDMWFLRIPKSVGDREGGAVQARFTSGNSAVAIDRGDYYQTGYIIEKGCDATLRATHEVAWLRERVGELFGWPTETLAAIRSWDDVKLLEVTVGMLDRWYVPGLLCIGDAAHTMSPVGGVGVNLAVQDAVAAARILARPLLDGTVRTADLEKVQRRRMLPASFTQRSQRGEHDMLIAPALRGSLDTAPLPLRIVDAVPMLAGLTAYLGGMGLRPEHAPDFARRPPVGATP
ncbi:FAD-dependent oxidoreductase [Nocardia mangyaensis]|uniref:FAD-dependent oxidoreductase n=1 Tax=Nocardia mangyaensis TaxID=2213200 RepID=UPI002674E0C9|nr:FAD-dependent oxidoreductase [Nocardia mangyaensis]MDO3650128.1 FAD-dependent oxidoreductase [Nocardia mangyaensis]